MRHQVTEVPAETCSMLENPMCDLKKDINPLKTQDVMNTIDLRMEA